MLIEKQSIKNTWENINSVLNKKQANLWCSKCPSKQITFRNFELQVRFRFWVFFFWMPRKSKSEIFLKAWTCFDSSKCNPLILQRWQGKERRWMGFRRSSPQEKMVNTLSPNPNSTCARVWLGILPFSRVQVCLSLQETEFCIPNSLSLWKQKFSNSLLWISFRLCRNFGSWRAVWDSECWEFGDWG